MRPQNLNSTATRILNLLTHCTTPSHILQIQAQIIIHKLHSNTFICNTLLKLFSHSTTPQKSLKIYSHMNKNSVLVNNYTFPFVLKTIADLKLIGEGNSVHAKVVKMGFSSDLYVGNSLLNLYGKVGDMVSCGKVFDEMPQRDVVSWTVVIAGFREIGKLDDALIIFERMRTKGVMPNRVTAVNALAACSGLGALDMGVWIHEHVRKSEWKLDVILGTSLVDMYMKCGRIEEGLRVFEEMGEKNVFTWNTVIKGLALANSGKEAVTLFSKMEEEEGLKPDEVSLIAVLSACVHSGFVHMGRRIFSSLVKGKYGFLPEVKHYACMVDLLARSGCLEEARVMINEMPFEPTVSIWGAFLGGCRVNGNLEMSEFAAWKLVELEPSNGSYYAVLSNLYAEMKRWSDVEKVRELMKERGMKKKKKKDLGSSSVELEHQEEVLELLVA